MTVKSTLSFLDFIGEIRLDSYVRTAPPLKVRMNSKPNIFEAPENDIENISFLQHIMFLHIRCKRFI